MTIDITSITTGDGTKYIVPNHYASGTQALTTLMYGPTIRQFYGTTNINTAFYDGVQTNAYFSLEEPNRFGTVRMNITTGLVATSATFQWYISTSTTQANGTKWLEVTPSLDETNGFTTTGTDLKIKFDFDHTTWTKGARGDNYGGCYLMCQCTSASGVTVQPVIDNLRVSVRSIEISNESIDLETLYTTIGDNSIIDKITDRTYYVKYNIFLDHATFTVPAYVHLDHGNLGYGNLANVWSVRDGADLNTDSVYNIGDPSNKLGATVKNYSNLGHIGRYQYHIVNHYNSSVVEMYSSLYCYFYGEYNATNSIFTANTTYLLGGSGELTNVVINNKTFYCYTTGLTLNGLYLNGTSIITCGWNRTPTLRGLNLTGNTRTDYVINGGTARAAFHLINTVGLDTDMLAVKYYTTTPTTDDGHVYQYFTANLRVADPEGVPIEGATVTITNGNSDVYTDTTDSEGVIPEQQVLCLDTYNNGSGGTGPYLYTDPENLKQEDDYSNVTIEVTHPDYGTYSLEHSLLEEINWTITLKEDNPQPTVVHNSTIYNSTIY